MNGKTGVTCKKCGEPVAAGARFCMGCGNDVSGQQGEAATAYMPSTKTQQFQRGTMDALREATLGEYEILAELGQGGMASVFLAHDIALDRKVAIKVMSPHLLSGEGMVERFKQEARTAAGLSHPHIIPIYAVKQVEDLLFFVMKFIEGRPLDEIIKEAAPLPEQVVRQIISKVAEALAMAHRGGVVHRDIKPANIMIDTEGTPVVTDFGIAKVTAKQGLTMTGATIGTPTYMSPEQCNALPITGASDQYSLGVMAYEMLTGRTLFDGDSVMTIMFKHVHEEPPPAAEFGPDVNPELAEAVRRMLAKESDGRYPNMEAVAAAFHSALGYDSPERKALVGFAMKGENRTILASVKTPRSPFPSAGHTRPKTSQPGKTSARTATSPSAATVVMPSGGRKSRLPLVAALVALLGGGGAAGWWFMQGGEAEGPVSTAGAATTPALTPPAVEATPQTPDPGPTDPVAETPQQQAPAPPQQRPAGPQPVASVQVVGSGGLQIGASSQLSASLTSSTGAALSGRAIRWESDNESVARVSQAGLVTSVGPGQATISALSEGQRGTLRVTVSEETVARVSVQPGQLDLQTQETGQLDVSITGSSGGTIDRPVQWTSSDARVARVSNGTVTAVAPGTATITATAGGQTAQAAVTVIRRELTADEHRGLISRVVADYAASLQARDVDAVRRLWPGMPPQREQQLRTSLPDMENLQVSLTVGAVRITGNTATAAVTGQWTFSFSGRAQTLPANNTFTLRRGENDVWQISEIQ